MGDGAGRDTPLLAAESFIILFQFVIGVAVAKTQLKTQKGYRLNDSHWIYLERE